MKNQVDTKRRTGAGIRYARTLQGMKLKELAAEIERSSTYVSRIETGEAEAKAGDLMAFAHVLNVPLEELRNPWLFSTIELVDDDDPDPDAATVGDSPRSPQWADDATYDEPIPIESGRKRLAEVVELPGISAGLDAA